MSFETILLIMTCLPFFLFILPEIKNKEGVVIRKYPKVSIIISAFNEEKVILRTVKSIFSSEYPKESIEILTIIDKKTSDKTVDLLKTINDKRLSIIFGGGSKSENLGIGLKNCTGEIVGIFDSDCVLEKDTIGNAIKSIQQNDGVIGRYSFINQKKREK